MDIRVKKVTQEEASKIIEDRVPLGRFWLQEGDVFVGIDNSTGDAWTEDFKTKGRCLGWLKK